jgi:hypothetical protein
VLGLSDLERDGTRPSAFHVVNLENNHHMFEISHIPQIFLNILSCNITFGVDEVADVEEFVFFFFGLAM